MMGTRKLSVPRFVTQRSLVSSAKARLIRRNERDRQQEEKDFALQHKELMGLMRDTRARFLLGEVMDPEILRTWLERRSCPFPHYALIGSQQHLSWVKTYLEKKEREMKNDDRSRDIRVELEVYVKIMTSDIKSRLNDIKQLADADERKIHADVKS
jgi:hypothetical protein